MKSNDFKQNTLFADSLDSKIPFAPLRQIVKEEKRWK